MTDVASQGQEESGYGEVKGEAGGMEGSARVKLIQCKTKKMTKSTVKIPDPPQSCTMSCTKYSIKLNLLEKWNWKSLI